MNDAIRNTESDPRLHVAECTAFEVSEFLQRWCRFTEPTNQTREAIVSTVESMVYHLMSQPTPQVLELVFSSDNNEQAPNGGRPWLLIGPQPLAKFIDFVYGPRALMIVPDLAKPMIRRENKLVLSIAPGLLTFGGRIMWPTLKD